MRFVHIIEINDPTQPLIVPLTRSQVWRGLLRRVEQPTEFLPQLTGCLIFMRGETTLARELNFGSFSVRDRVRLEPERQIVIETEAAKDVPAGRLVMTIEEPGEALLQIRFHYEINRERSADEAMEQKFDRYVQSAYLEADIDSVRIIRALADAKTL